ncbi:hypothetical protein F2Q69_00037961 [Brassica cretica]|uniref:Uncharacterized protein n=1 Tax=Brassica cretica TaxID=69181 RepID=A0A8S9SLQ9_BRACR|nr:hypothetical protein F2Q69_00037961 [Brassica cretica]
MENLKRNPNYSVFKVSTLNRTCDPWLYPLRQAKPKILLKLLQLSFHIVNHSQLLSTRVEPSCAFFLLPLFRFCNQPAYESSVFGQFKINHLDSSGEASTSAVKKWKTGSVLEMLKSGEKRWGQR